MKVKELISKLQGLDQNEDIYFWNDEKDYIGSIMLHTLPIDENGEIDDDGKMVNVITS